MCFAIMSHLYPEKKTIRHDIDKKTTSFRLSNMNFWSVASQIRNFIILIIYRNSLYNLIITINT